MYKVYKYTNLIDGKVYIGQTCQTLRARAGSNGINYCQNPRFFKAIEEFGWDNFKGEIILDNLNHFQADYYESYYINLHKSTDETFGYNISDGAHTPIADCVREVLSEKAKERYKDPTKNPMYGKKHSEETLKKMSEAKQGKKNPMYGVSQSKETIEKRKKTNEMRGYTYNTHKWTNEERAMASKRFKEVAKRWAKPIMCLEDGLSFESITDAAKHYGCSESVIGDYLKGKQRSCAGGRHFKYISQN